MLYSSIDYNSAMNRAVIGVRLLLLLLLVGASEAGDRNFNLTIINAALLPRRGPHYASHSVRLSVRPSRYRYRASRRAT